MAEVPQAVGRESQPPPGIELHQFRPSFEALGRIANLLAGQRPFATFDFGNLIRAVQHQLSSGCNVAAVTDRRQLVGYVGWMQTTAAIAAAWVDGNGPLTPRTEGADAVVLTVVVAADRKILAALIRRARGLSRGRRVYYKRQYADAVRPPRKSTVANRI